MSTPSQSLRAMGSQLKYGLPRDVTEMTILNNQQQHPCSNFKHLIGLSKPLTEKSEQEEREAKGRRRNREHGRHRLSPIFNMSLPQTHFHWETQHFHSAP